MKEQQKKQISELVWECAEISVQSISFTKEVREACERNVCGKYNTSWLCPPAVGSLDYLKDKYQKYKTAFVFTTKHLISDSFDFEGMLEAGKEHKKIESRIKKIIKGVNYAVLTSGCCDICDKCSFPKKSCRHPDRTAPSLEACGVDVVALAATANILYYNGENTVTYFSAILY